MVRRFINSQKTVLLLSLFILLSILILCIGPTFTPFQLTNSASQVNIPSQTPYAILRSNPNESQPRIAETRESRRLYNSIPTTLCLAQHYFSTDQSRFNQDTFGFGNPHHSKTKSTFLLLDLPPPPNLL
jgi:hypothetical protein